MKKAILKILLALFPFICITVFYVIKDPFQIIYHYNVTNNPSVGANRDYFSTELFLKNFPRYRYDSYIFGGSRSKNYLIEDWQKHISFRSCFHYDGASETLFGIERKVNFLKQRNVEIKNALFVVDASLLSEVNNSDGHVFRKHPAITGESWLSFQIVFLKDFFDVEFLKTYFGFLMHQDNKGSTAPNKMWGTPEEFVDSSNEQTLKIFEKLIAENKDSFYSHRQTMFPKRDGIYKESPAVLKAPQIKLLESIKDNLAKDCNYKIVVSPLYDQVTLNPADLKVLDSVFGKDHVFDFSGINELTATQYNYYEYSHYRPFIAARVMDSIYKK